MAKRPEKPGSRIEIISASLEQAPILANLLELYAHDFSEFHGIALGEDGRFGYRSLPLYWSEPGRHPFLVRIKGKLAGFALVKKGSEISGKENVWDMAEFFVLRGFRRSGFGTHIAHEVWKRFPGAWEVRVMQSNVSANHFWGHAISMFAGEVIHPVEVEKDGERWSL
jgi:predicted acetyltransferase